MEAEIFIIYFVLKQCKNKVYTVQLTCAKLPANAGNITCGPHVERLQTQFTCVTCSLPVEKPKFTRNYAKNTSGGTHTNCLQPPVNLLEYNGFLQVILHAELRQFCPRLACKVELFLQAKLHAFPSKNTCNLRPKYPQLRVICYHTAGKFTCKSQVR